VVLPLIICSVAPFSVAPLPLDVLLAYLLVNVLGLGIAGASATVSATLWVSFLMLLAYVLLSKKFSETWRGFSTDTFKYVLPAVKLATPSAIMVWSVYFLPVTYSIVFLVRCGCVHDWGDVSAAAWSYGCSSSWCSSPVCYRIPPLTRH